MSDSDVTLNQRRQHVDAISWAVGALGWRYLQVRDLLFAEIPAVQAELPVDRVPSLQLQADALALRRHGATDAAGRTPLQHWALSVARLVQSAPAAWLPMLAPRDRDLELSSSVFMGARAYTRHDAGSFFGRGAERAQLAQAFATLGRLVVVSGARGVGKTSLVEVVGAQLVPAARWTTLAAAHKPSLATLTAPEWLHLDGLTVQSAADPEFLAELVQAIRARKAAARPTIISTRCAALIGAPIDVHIALTPLIGDERRTVLRQLLALAPATLPLDQLERLVGTSAGWGALQTALKTWRPPAALRVIDPCTAPTWEPIDVRHDGALLRLLQCRKTVKPRALALADARELNLLDAVHAFDEAALLQVTEAGTCFEMTPAACTALPPQRYPSEDNLRALTALMDGRLPSRAALKALEELPLLRSEHAAIALGLRRRVWRLIALSSAIAIIAGVALYYWYATTQMRVQAWETAFRAQTRIEPDPIVQQTLLSVLRDEPIVDEAAVIALAGELQLADWRPLARWPALRGPAVLTADGALMADGDRVYRRRLDGTTQAYPALGAPVVAMAPSATPAVWVSVDNGTLQRVEPSGVQLKINAPPGEVMELNARTAWLLARDEPQLFEATAAQTTQIHAGNDSLGETGIAQSGRCVAVFLGHDVWFRCGTDAWRKTTQNIGKIMAMALFDDHLAYISADGRAFSWTWGAEAVALALPATVQCQNARLMTRGKTYVFAVCPHQKEPHARVLRWTKDAVGSTGTLVDFVPRSTQALAYEESTGRLAYADDRGQVGLLHPDGRRTVARLAAEGIRALRWLSADRLALITERGEVRVFSLRQPWRQFARPVLDVTGRSALSVLLAPVSPWDPPDFGPVDAPQRPLGLKGTLSIARSRDGGLAMTDGLTLHVEHADHPPREISLAGLPEPRRLTDLAWPKARLQVTVSEMGHAISKWRLVDGRLEALTPPSFGQNARMLEWGVTPNGEWQVAVVKQARAVHVIGRSATDTFDFELDRGTLRTGTPPMALSTEFAFVADGPTLHARLFKADRTVRWAELPQSIDRLHVASDAVFAVAGNAVWRWSLSWPAALDDMQPLDGKPLCLTRAEIRAHAALLAGRSVPQCPHPKEPSR